MLSVLYLAVLAGAGVLTYEFGVRANGSFFSSLVAFALWGFLTFQTEILTISGGEEIVWTIPASLRFLFAGFALLAAFETLWQLLGTDDSMTTDDNFAMER